MSKRTYIIKWLYLIHGEITGFGVASLPLCDPKYPPINMHIIAVISKCINWKLNPVFASGYYHWNTSLPSNTPSYLLYKFIRSAISCDNFFFVSITFWYLVSNSEYFYWISSFLLDPRVKFPDWLISSLCIFI